MKIHIEKECGVCLITSTKHFGSLHQNLTTWKLGKNYLNFRTCYNVTWVILIMIACENF